MTLMKIIATRIRDPFTQVLRKGYTWSWEIWEDNKILAIGTNRPLLQNGFDTKKKALDAAYLFLDMMDPKLDITLDEGNVVDECAE